MSPLAISEMLMSKGGPKDMGKPIFVATCGKRGASITKPTIEHKMKLVIAVQVFIILGLGISTKSAPLIPDSIEIIVKAIIKKMDSIREAAMTLADG
jgi:hypothetical protein